MSISSNFLFIQQCHIWYEEVGGLCLLIVIFCFWCSYFSSLIGSWWYELSCCRGVSDWGHSQLSLPDPRQRAGRRTGWRGTVSSAAWSYEYHGLQQGGTAWSVRLYAGLLVVCVLSLARVATNLENHGKRGILRELSGPGKFGEFSGNSVQLHEKIVTKQNIVTRCGFWGAKLL